MEKKESFCWQKNGISVEFLSPPNALSQHYTKLYAISEITWFNPLFLLLELLHLFKQIDKFGVEMRASMEEKSKTQWKKIFIEITIVIRRFVSP